MTDQTTQPLTEPFRCTGDGRVIEWREESGEARSVALHPGEAGELLFVFMRGDVETRLRVSSMAAEAMATLLESHAPTRARRLLDQIGAYVVAATTKPHGK